MSDTIELPHSDELERSVLGMMFLSTGAARKALGLLDEGAFFRERHRHIFNALSRVHTEHDTSDLVLVSDALTRDNLLEQCGGITYLADVSTQAASTVNIEQHCRALLEKEARRKTIALAEQMRTDATQDGENWFRTVGAYEAELQKLSGNERMSALTPTSAFTGDVYDALGRNDPGLMTHLPSLNYKTNGFQPGEVVIIGARPGIGKTALALGFALHAAIHEDTPVAVFSLEMTKERLVRRLMWNLSGVNTKGRQPTESEWSALGRAAARIEKAPIYVDDESGLTAQQIHARADTMQRKHGLGLIVVDYLGLVRSAKTRGNHFEELEETMQGFQTMAKRLACPLLLLSQVTRSVAHEHRSPKLADFFGGTTIEATCDVALMLHRPAESMDKGSAEYEESLHIAELYIEKNRDGEPGKISLYWEPHLTRFTQAANVDDEAAFAQPTYRKDIDD